MGADGYIINPNEPIQAEVRCYRCSRFVSWVQPDLGHEGCLRDGHLAVSIEITNYEER